MSSETHLDDTSSVRGVCYSVYVCIVIVYWKINVTPASSSFVSSASSAPTCQVGSSISESVKTVSGASKIYQGVIGGESMIFGPHKSQPTRAPSKYRANKRAFKSPPRRYPLNILSQVSGNSTILTIFLSFWYRISMFWYYSQNLVNINDFTQNWLTIGCSSLSCNTRDRVHRPAKTATIMYIKHKN